MSKLALSKSESLVDHDSRIKLVLVDKFGQIRRYLGSFEPGKIIEIGLEGQYSIEEI